MRPTGSDKVAFDLRIFHCFALSPSTTIEFDIEVVIAVGDGLHHTPEVVKLTIIISEVVYVSNVVSVLYERSILDRLTMDDVYRPQMREVPLFEHQRRLAEGSVPWS